LGPIGKLLSLVIALVLFLVVVAAIWYVITPQTANFTIQVQSNTSWTGSYGNTGSSTSVDGSGNENFQVQGTTVSAVFQMNTGNVGDSLTVSIVRDGTVLATQTTTAAYGEVSVSANSSQHGPEAVQIQFVTKTHLAFGFTEAHLCHKS